MLTKSKVIESINKLPESFSIDEIIDRLFLLEKIENGLKQSEEGKVVKDSELESKLPKWLK